MFMKCKVTVDTSHYPKEGPWELPEGWVWTTIGELCTVFSAKRVHQSDWQKVGIPFYRAREIVKLSEHGYVDNDLFISEKLYNEFIGTGLIPGPGDIMISAVGTIGKTYIVRATDRFYFKDASVLCLRNPYLIPAYLDLYLQSTLARTQMHDGSKGTTVDTITIEKASDYLIPIPPSAEQERIVSYLDSILPILVSIESQKACIENLIDKTKQRILDLAIHGKLVSQDPTDEPAIELIKRMNPAFQPSHNLHYEDCPNGWQVVTLKEIIILYSGRDLESTCCNAQRRGIPYLVGASCIENKRISVYRWTEYPEVVAKRNDILLSCKGTVGEVVLNQLGNVHIARQFMAIRSKSPQLILPEYVEIMIKSSIDKLRSAARGIIPGIAREDILEMVVAIPPVSEQRQILKRIDEIEKSLALISLNICG